MPSIVILLAALAASPAPEQAAFSFEDVTETVGLRDSNAQFRESYYTAQTVDPHVIGGSFVDLNGDGYPEMILPAQRNPLKEPFDQDRGGFVILANIEDPLNPPNRIFDNTPLGQAQNPAQPFDTPFPGSEGHEVQGILAADFNNDGKLDLLIICGGEYEGTPASGAVTDMSVFEGNIPGPDGPVDKSMRNLLFINMTLTPAEAGGGFDEGEFSFGKVDYGGTDPTPGGNLHDVKALDGHGIQYTQEPSSVEPAFEDISGAFVHGVAINDRTIFPTHSSVANAADINRDGKLDLFIGAHHRSADPEGGLRSGQMSALYLNVGNVQQTLTRETIILGVNQNTPTPASVAVPQFADISYDRTRYPAAFIVPPATPQPLQFLIAWQDYLPMFGLQGRCNCRNSYILPCSNPTRRFSSTNAAVFTDLNNDNWPDLVVTNKGTGISPFWGPPGGGHTVYPYQDSDMIYINRGSRLNSETGQMEWLGFWNRSWDLLEDSPDGQFDTGVPMGIAVADYDMDGDMDFFMSDFSFKEEAMMEKFGVVACPQCPPI